jgi:hypothetical protein
MAEVLHLRPDQLSDAIFDQLADAGASRVEVRRLSSRLWTASAVVGGRRRIEEGGTPHTCLRRLLVRCEALSGGPGGAA